MAKRKGLNQNREYYRTRCDEVNPFDESLADEVNAVIERLRKELRNRPKLQALCAPQVGSRYRIVCMRFEGNDIRTLINPMVIERKELFVDVESQIGFDDRTQYFIPRYRELMVGYQTPMGKVESNVFRDDTSTVFEQMLQLLDGVFVSDIGLEKLDGFDELPEEEKDSIIRGYLQTILGMNGVMEDFIETDEAMQRQVKMTKFYTDVMLGKVEVLPMTDEEKELLRVKEEPCPTSSDTTR